MAIDVAGASAYFAPGRHIRAGVWAKFADAQTRAGAVYHALTMVRRLLPVGYTIDTDATSPTDFPRHDAAVYEQALYLLENGPAASDGSANAPRVLEEIDGPSAPRVVTPAAPYSPECLAWIAHDTGRVTLVNG